VPRGEWPTYAGDAGANRAIRRSIRSTIEDLLFCFDSEKVENAAQSIFSAALN
jgi:hypothetical protein